MGYGMQKQGKSWLLRTFYLFFTVPYIFARPTFLYNFLSIYPELGHFFWISDTKSKLLYTA